MRITDLCSDLSFRKRSSSYLSVFFILIAPNIAYPLVKSVVGPAFQGLSQSYMLFIFLLPFHYIQTIRPYFQDLFLFPSTKLKCIFKSQPAKVNTISVNEQLKSTQNLLCFCLWDIQIKFKIVLCPHTVDFIVQNSVLISFYSSI